MLRVVANTRSDDWPSMSKPQTILSLPKLKLALVFSLPGQETIGNTRFHGVPCWNF